jgi:serine/threonine protein kinase
MAHLPQESRRINRPKKPCPACATENSDTSQRCSVCGGSLEPTLATTVVATTRKPTREPGPTSDSDSSVHGRFLPGTKIAERYRIVSLAGRGGMGEVYRADDLKLGHPVALKFLPREVKEGSRSFQHFLSEVRLSRQIAHPNVYSPTTLLTHNGVRFAKKCLLRFRLSSCKNLAASS